MPNLKLILSIIDYLKREAKNEENPDTQESLEVAVQCLETAYDIDAKVNKTALTVSLEDIFECSFPEPGEVEDATSVETMHKAEIMKNLGNNLMKTGQFSEAIRYYTAAIEIDNQNAIYYCNRAAAYSKLNDFQNAIKDCEKAIVIDPLYAKAFGRMGLAHSSLGQIDEAIKAFKQAAELDPFNDSYLSNLKLVMEKKNKPADRPGGGLPGLNSVDWHSLFSNTEFRNMASTIMQDPTIINALSGLSANMSGPTTPVNNIGAGDGPGPGPGPGPAHGPAPGPAPGPAAGSAPGPAPGQNRSLDMLIEAGHYLAAQIQAANPDLLDQFRQPTPPRTPQNQDNSDSSQ